MLTANDMKKLFSEEYSFEQNDKKVYLVPLKEFMKTEEFATFPSISCHNKDNRTGETTITKCQFLNSSCWTDVHPQMIINKTKTEKTIQYVDLDHKAVGGEFPDVQYEIMVRVNEDGTLNRDYIHEVQKGRFKNKDGKFENTWYYKDGCVRFCPVEYPRYYIDPSF